MSHTPITASKDEDEVPPPQRPPSPPIHTTFAVRGVHPPNFSAFKPRDFRQPSSQRMTHVSWNCDGRKLAAVGIDKSVKVWSPDKSLEPRSATVYSGGHSDDVDYVSWNPVHPELFCSSSQRDRRIIFWDARQSRYVQQVSLRVPVARTAYSPDGRSLIYTTTKDNLFWLEYCRKGDDAKEEWHNVPFDFTCPDIADKSKADKLKSAHIATTAVWNHAGNGFIVSHETEHSLRVMEFPTLETLSHPAAHVGGCIALALDPRGKYLASGGHDSIVNIFETEEWLCARTITVCDHSITSLSFSHDGEYLAIANTGTYIDICATETGVPLHRVPTLGPVPTVTWHPSKPLIAYCGQTKVKEGGPPPVAVVSLFGVAE